MAKKLPTELTVEERLKLLFQLQTCLSQIDEKRALRGELPLEVKDLEDDLEGLAIRIERIKREISEITAAVSEKNAEIAEATAILDRYKQQLDEVRNNREYDTLTKEIEFKTLEIELCNKKIREANMAIERKQSELEAAEQQVEERNADLDEKRSALDEIMDETRTEEERLKVKVRELEGKIEPRLLSAFKRIRENARNGKGIDYVWRDACGGCNNKIPPQRQIDIKMHKKIIVCEYCGRIMIDPELAGVKIAAPVDDKPKRLRKRPAATSSKKKEEDVPEAED